MPAAVYVAFIFVMGSLPSAPPGAARMSDKLLHLLGFAVLWPMLQLALSTLASDRSWAWRGAASVAIASGVGGALELWQALLPHRSCELLDWVADSLGAALALSLALPVRRLMARPGGTP